MVQEVSNKPHKYTPGIHEHQNTRIENGFLSSTVGKLFGVCLRLCWLFSPNWNNLLQRGLSACSQAVTNPCFNSRNVLPGQCRQHRLHWRHSETHFAKSEFFCGPACTFYTMWDCVRLWRVDNVKGLQQICSNHNNTITITLPIRGFEIIQSYRVLTSEYTLSKHESSTR